MDVVSRTKRQNGFMHTVTLFTITAALTLALVLVFALGYFAFKNSLIPLPASFGGDVPEEEQDSPGTPALTIEERLKLIQEPPKGTVENEDEALLERRNAISAPPGDVSQSIASSTEARLKEISR